MQTHSPGILDSLRQLSAAGARLYRARFEMAILELQEEWVRAKRSLFLWTGAAVLLLFGLALAVATGIYYLALVIGMGLSLAAFAGLFLLAGVVLFFSGRKPLDGHALLAQTRAEFEKDRLHFKRIIEERRATQQEEAEEEAARRHFSRSTSLS